MAHAMPATGEHSGDRMLRAIGDGFRYVRAPRRRPGRLPRRPQRHGLWTSARALPRGRTTHFTTGAHERSVCSTPHRAPARCSWPSSPDGSRACVAKVAWSRSSSWPGARRWPLFGLVHIVWIGLICLGIAGAMDVISTVLRNTILQNAITDEFRSRISSIQMAVVTGGPRLGDVESGLVANFTSTEFSIVSGGIACVVGVIVLMRWRPTFWNQRSDLSAPHGYRFMTGVGHRGQLATRRVD